jgi:glycosyltransferase involved in cell wall biosynthesis
MRILYLNPCGLMGGAETALLELLASLDAAAGDRELWLVLGEDGPLGERARKLSVQVVVELFPPALARLGDAGQKRVAILWSLVKAIPEMILYTRRLSRICQRVDPDIVHTNGFKMHLLGIWSSPRRSAVVWHIHDYVGARPLMSRLLRPFREACAAAIADSKSVAAELRELLPGLRVVPIYNAVDMERFAPTGNRLDLDTLAGLSPAPPGTVRVGLVATFARWKGHKVFLKALSQLPASLSVRGYVIGGPIYQTSGSQWSMQELEQEADELGIAGRVGFTGFLDDTAAAMRSLDIVVHASTEPEPFGMVIVEGMACGKAVIASRTGGAAELFVEGENALSHSPGDAMALAHQILRLAEDDGLRRRLGLAGRGTAERFYRGKRLASEVLALYREVRGEPAGRETPVEIPSSVLHQ